MKALIDADILRYEIGFGCSVGREEGDDPPPFEWAERLLLSRIEEILKETGADSYCLYLSGPDNFRDKIAVTKPYKGTRKSEKPYHWHNLTAYMTGVLPHKISEGIEADDLMCIDQTDDTIICSRDKDLRQCPGWHYGWEINNQPSFGPELVDKMGWIKLHPNRKKIVGCGLSFFYSQMLTGDTVDNIPGCPGVGPVKAFDLLEGATTPEELSIRTQEAYLNAELGVHWMEYMLEQGRLLWMVRRFDEDGEPVMWNIGDEK